MHAIQLDNIGNVWNIDDYSLDIQSGHIYKNTESQYLF